MTKRTLVTPDFSFHSITTLTETLNHPLLFFPSHVILPLAPPCSMLDWIDAIKSAVEDIRKQQQLQREMEKQQEQRFEAALERQASENQAAPAAHSSSLDGEEPELQSTEGGNGSASATAALMAVGAAARPNGTGRPGNAKPGSSAFAIEALPQPALDVSDSRSAWAELDKYSMTPEEWDRLQQVIKLVAHDFVIFPCGGRGLP